MAKTTKLTLHPKFPIGELSPRLYGAFLEPITTNTPQSGRRIAAKSSYLLPRRSGSLAALKCTGTWSGMRWMSADATITSHAIRTYVAA